MRCFQGLAGLLAGTGLVAMGATMMVGCGADFSGCEASRTCPSKGGAAGMAGTPPKDDAGSGGTGLAPGQGGSTGGGDAQGTGGSSLGHGGRWQGTGGDSPGPGESSSGSDDGGTGGGGGTSLSGLAGEGGEQSGGAGDGACPKGFTGPDCAENIDDCASDPCGTLPNSHCVDGVATHTCACDSGFVGAGCLPRFELLTPEYGFSVGDAISADGTVVVGSLADTPQSSNHPFRWTHATGSVTLVSNSDTVDWGFATGVSTDGSVIAGNASMSSQEGTYRWTESTGVTFVGPGNEGFVSGNGSTVAGRDLSPSDGAHIFRWTTGAGLKDLGNVGSFVYVYALSADGTTIAGSVDDRAFIWTSGDGVRKIGPTGTSSEARAVSNDGRVTVGTYFDGDTQQVAFVWTRPQTFVDVDLGQLTETEATGVNGDGSVIVGTTNFGENSWIWSSAKGPRLITDVLSEKGVDASRYADWKIHDVSDDGTVVIGSVTVLNTQLVTQAFIARIGD